MYSQSYPSIVKKMPEQISALSALAVISAKYMRLAYAQIGMEYHPKTGATYYEVIGHYPDGSLRIKPI